MTRRTLKSTTAGLLVISLLQPVPAMAQIRAPQAVPSLGEGERLHRVQALAENETCFTAGAVDMERCDITMMRAELEALMQNGLPDPAERGVEDDETAALTVEERIALLIAAI